MKPIRLDIAGLNSFRKNVSIDFGDLVRDGLFGIFGPTGSGKSTILDAITLALYGTVRRSANRGGFINEREEECSVSFTFEVSDGTDRKRYRVERHYRKSKTGGVEARRLRLSEFDADDNPTPVVEKAREVNGYVQEILGINADDFLRAVVLPQGAFSDFLSLKATDRSRMLERLFSLEHLGDRLTKTLRARRDQKSGDIRIIEERLALLADYNDDAVTDLEKQATAAELEWRRSSDLARTAADAHTQARELFALITELSRFRLSEHEREESLERIRRIEGELDRADRARALLPILEAVADSEERSRKAEDAHREAGVRHQQASAAAENAERALEEIAAQEKERLPQLEDQRRELERARGIEENLTKQRREYNTVSTTLASEQEALKKLEGDVDAARNEEKTIRDEIVRLQDQEKEYAISEAERTRITTIENHLRDRRPIATAIRDRRDQHENDTKAVESLVNAIEQKTRELSRLKENINDRNASIADLERRDAELSKRVSEEKESADKLVHGMDELERLAIDIAAIAKKEGDERQKIEERKRNLTLLANQGQKESDEYAALEKSLNRKREELDAMMYREALATLSEKLVEGVVCPLCGSPHHPYPFHERPDERGVKGEGVSKEVVRQAEAAVSKKGEEVAALRAEYKAKREELRGMEGALEDRSDELREKNKILASRLRTLLPESEEESIDVARRRRSEASQQVEMLSRDLESLKTQLKKENDERSELVARAQTREVDLGNDQGILKAKQQALKKDGDALETDERRLKEIDDAIVQLSTKGDLAGAEREVSDFKERETRLSDVRTNIESRRRRKDELDDRRRVLEARREETLRRHDRVEVDAARLRDAIDEAERDVRRMIITIVDAERQDVPIERLIADCANEIDLLRKTIDNVKHDVQQSRENRARAEQDLANADGHMKRSASDLELARAEAAQALLRAGYSSAEAVGNDVRDEESVRALRQELQTRTTALEIASKRMGELISGIGDRTMSSGELDRLENEERTTSEAADQWTKELSVLQSHLNTAREKNVQWRDANEAKGREGEQAKRYERLERYLRANGFVNFVANEHLTEICRRATRTLGSLTGGRYEVMARGSDGFVIGDNRLGGERYPGTLSGGETFLVSLSLALALSDTLQFERRPLEFFFLDEGFGSLDAELLETVIDSLERLATPERAIGLISHVGQLRDRIQRRLIVSPPSGLEGTTVVSG